jgi:hypothetical protein
MSIDPKRPYPEGLAWDEAWRQRQRADRLQELIDEIDAERNRRNLEAIAYLRWCSDSYKSR